MENSMTLKESPPPFADDDKSMMRLKIRDKQNGISFKNKLIEDNCHDPYPGARDRH